MNESKNLIVTEYTNESQNLIVTEYTTPDSNVKAECTIYSVKMR